MSHTTISEIQQEIVNWFGHVPSFFKPAESNALVLKNLWNQTLTSYLQNPLPRLFVEKLAAKLSRYSTVPYCLINHCSSLHAAGLNGEEIYNLLESPTVIYDEMLKISQKLKRDNFDEWVQADSELENFIIDCGVGIYLNKNSHEILSLLKDYVSNDEYHYILMLISYKKSAHLWSESHSVINYNKDAKLKEHFNSMLSEEEKLSHYFESYVVNSDSLLWHQKATSERQLKLISNALPALIAYMDVNKKYRFVNTAYERWFGVNSVDLIGVLVKDFVGEAVFEKANPYLERALKGEIVEFEQESAYKQGTRFIHVSYTPDIDSHGKVRGVVSLVNDISIQKNIEKDLKRAVSSRDEFLSVASHELMTPLTSIQLHTQMIQRSVQKNKDNNYDVSKLLKFVDQTGQQVHKLTRLVDDMLDISRTDSGKLSYHLDKFNINSLVNDVVEKLQPLARQAKVNMSLQISGEAEVYWDSFRIDQVLTNLISNAIRYGQGTPIEVYLDVLDKNVIIKVVDFGPGIDPIHQERIFQRFERASMKDIKRGLGLGLYICKEIVLGHGGSIHVESELGKGSAFIVQIPIT